MKTINTKKEKELTLLKEWDFLPFDEIKYTLIKAFREYLKLSITINELDNCYGFAYTSSGKNAGLWACNGVKLPFNDEYNDFIGIVIDEYLQSYLVFDNEKEESIFVSFVKLAHSKVNRDVFQNNRLNELAYKAQIEVREYLKAFDGKKITTNKGLSSKLKLPTFTVNEQNPFGNFNFSFHVDYSYSGFIDVKCTTCLNGGAYNHDNFGHTSAYCNYIRKSLEVGKIDNDGIYKYPTFPAVAPVVFDANKVNATKQSIKELEKQIDKLNKEKRELEYSLPQSN